MPRACPVDRYAGLYRSRSVFAECHGLVPWIVTLPSVSLHGASPWHPRKRGRAGAETNVRHHGASPWHPFLSQHRAQSKEWVDKIDDMHLFEQSEGGRAKRG